MFIIKREVAVIKGLVDFIVVDEGKVIYLKENEQEIKHVATKMEVCCYGDEYCRLCVFGKPKI